jgi:hypothetical protein
MTILRTLLPSFSLVASVVVLAACGSGIATTAGDAGSSGSSGSSGPSGGGAGFDCPTLRDKQATANCPKFDGAKYLASCEQTKASVPAGCKAKLDALANCVLSQPIGCTANGNIDDTTPAACKAQDDAVSACFSDAGK